MKTIRIHGDTGASTILVGEVLESLGKYAPLEKTVVITDTNVRRHYQKDFPPCEIIEIKSGEKIKTLDTVKEIYQRLTEIEADRSSFIVAIGGGVVCDIAGFVASTYMRGVRFGFVSTTLLSQVDASVGGKNGVNLGGYKNMVGVFNQPEFVICDLNLLKTLPEKDLLSGFAEIVKHAIIGDPELFSYLEENYERGLSLDTDVINRLVCDSIVIKSSIVNRDEKETGERRKLNFGHTFGHAIEKTTGASHGEAISAGMVIASVLSNKRGYLSAEDAEKIEGLLEKLKLPTRLPFDLGTVLDALRKDKKRNGNSINFVLLRAIGDAVVEKISIKELETAISDLKAFVNAPIPKIVR
ncbi:MAG TPA: 3-dehydroquinate synthase [Deltaproteobacteria bacterium]|nr:3-dehydroquinate synthase [Deltaproteobacteria bacterium]